MQEERHLNYNSADVVKKMLEKNLFLSMFVDRMYITYSTLNIVSNFITLHIKTLYI